MIVYQRYKQRYALIYINNYYYFFYLYIKHITGRKWLNSSQSTEIQLQNQQSSHVKAGGGRLKSSNKGEIKPKTALNYKNASTITCPSQVDS